MSIRDDFEELRTLIKEFTDENFKLRKENAELKSQLKESEEAYALLQKMRSES